MALRHYILASERHKTHEEEEGLCFCSLLQILRKSLRTLSNLNWSREHVYSNGRHREKACCYILTC